MIILELLLHMISSPLLAIFFLHFNESGKQIRELMTIIFIFLFPICQSLMKQILSRVSPVNPPRFHLIMKTRTLNLTLKTTMSTTLNLNLRTLTTQKILIKSPILLPSHQPFKVFLYITGAIIICLELDSYITIVLYYEMKTKLYNDYPFAADN